MNKTYILLRLSILAAYDLFVPKETRDKLETQVEELAIEMCATSKRLNTIAHLLSDTYDYLDDTEDLLLQDDFTN